MLWVSESKKVLRKEIDLQKIRIKKFVEKFITHTWGGPRAACPICTKGSGEMRPNGASLNWGLADASLTPGLVFSPSFRHSVCLSPSKVY